MTRTSRSLALLLSAALLAPLGLTACSDKGSSEAKVVTKFDATKIKNQVAIWDITDNQYKLRAAVLDNRVKIRPGEAVVWVSEGNTSHTVTHVPDEDSGEFDITFDSKPLVSGDAFVMTFWEPGIYEFHCTFHPTVMSGRVVVEENTKG